MSLHSLLTAAIMNRQTKHQHDTSLSNKHMYTPTSPCYACYNHTRACFPYQSIACAGLCVVVRRFDLLHVMLDELTEEDDGRIAAHIVALHKDPAATIGRAPFTMEQLQRFIKYARSIKPRITREVGTVMAVSV